ncbi:MAG: penicillin-binding protein 2 [Chloroflexi bacterium]|nr:penicillin-binding protein 2 [Chloroflexota bacterium]
MMEQTAEPSHRHRIGWLAAVLLAVGVILLGRLASWQLVPRPEIRRWTLAGGNRPNVIPAARGNILDRHGHYLASSTVEYEVAVSPRLLGPKQRERLLPELATILNQEPSRLQSLLAQQQSDYILLGTNLPPEVGKRFETMEQSSDAFSIQVDFRRVYPDGSLAASLLGFVDYQGHGQYGLEKYYDRELSGTPGRWYGIRDPWGKQILVTLGGYQPARDGADLILTIDRNIQYMAERILREGLVRYRAQGGNVIVLDPRTGAVLAMANLPTYEPGRYGECAERDGLEVFINTSISALYEPGSTFKPVTLAAGLEAHVITPQSTYDDRGEIIVGNRRIWNSNQAAYGITNMTQMIAKSLNVGAAHVANLLGPTRFYEIVRRFGFFEATGVDLAFEERGLMRVPGDPYWHMSDLGANSYGQGISVTPLQMAVAYATLANDGIMMRPYVVQEIWQNGELVQSRQPFVVRRVVSAETARQVTQILVDAVEMGMEKAVLPGYRLAGKSGTSGIPTRDGYDSQDTIASFVGYGPVEDPRFVILVKFDRPREGKWGLEVAAPEFRRMAEMLVDYWAIPPSSQTAQR